MTRRLLSSRPLLLPLLLMSLAAPLAGAAPSEVLVTLSADREAAEARDHERLAALVEDREALEAALARAREARDEARRWRNDLDAQRATLAARHAALETRREEQGQELTSLLSTLQRHSTEMRDILADSWLTLGGATLPPRLDEVEVLELAHVEELADSLLELTVQSGRVVALEAPVAGTDGEVTRRELVLLGDMAAFSGGQMLRRGADADIPSVVSHTPPSAGERLAAFQAGDRRALALDPTRGTLLEALARRPTLIERFHQGGAVGYVVVALGALGLLVALAQYGYLLRVSMAVRRQRRQIDQWRDDNPLGRVLCRFRQLPDGLAPEALEARLDEAMLAEQPRLERGQALVKLLAAVAPLLGLLGTVTGMIVTFQSITVFGTGDPQLMAGGIGQALVTTVLGLITAVPLLFAHTALVSRCRQLIGIVEGEASAALAEHLEARVSPSGQGVEPRSHHASLA
ncbi:MotA/TolQ/ExbB proton channel family protein [Halomonas aquatica]|uniref:MotA/TolQ/ExbB proton channel family protein n=1 Tax=Halomonas aquatica TaxID=3151123 RepID=A0ABV1NIN5_9GAMM